MEKKLKILAATDYSDVAENALKFAFQLAHSIHADLYLLHVYNVPFSSTPSNPNELIKNDRDYRKAELNALEHVRNALYSEFNVSEKEMNVNCLVQTGKAGKAIRNEAGDINADFIVLGTHGVSKFRKTFLGSHTWEVIGKSSIPVFAIPNYVKYKKIKNIVFGCEFREGEIAAINYLSHFAKKLHAKLILLHVANNKSTDKLEADKLEQFKLEVEKEIMYTNLEYKFCRNSDVVHGLTNFCIKVNAEILAMSPEKSSVLKFAFSPSASKTREMSFESHIPLLSVPDYFDPEYSKFWNLFRMQTNFQEEDL